MHFAGWSSCQDGMFRFFIHKLIELGCQDCEAGVAVFFQVCKEVEIEGSVILVQIHAFQTTIRIVNDLIGREPLSTAGTFLESIRIHFHPSFAACLQTYTSSNIDRIPSKLDIIVRFILSGHWGQFLPYRAQKKRP